VLEEEVVVVVDEPADEELDELAGLVLSFGTPLAKGLRAIRASKTLAGTFELSGVADWPSPDVVVEPADAAGGTGTVAAPPAGAVLSSNTGTAATPTISSATTIQSLRS